ncbi:hypothetical protein IMZ48_31050, partial [Candidatus Bathyarchaeota archaeon]|nr:hypothetical protein [Candidatus Bathyarchaeota archaeon]
MTSGEVTREAIVADELSSAPKTDEESETREVVGSAELESESQQLQSTGVSEMESQGSSHELAPPTKKKGKKKKGKKGVLPDTLEPAIEEQSLEPRVTEGSDILPVLEGGHDVSLLEEGSDIKGVPRDTLDPAIQTTTEGGNDVLPATEGGLDPLRIDVSPVPGGESDILPAPISDERGRDTPDCEPTTTGTQIDSAPASTEKIELAGLAPERPEDDSVPIQGGAEDESVPVQGKLEDESLPVQGEPGDVILPGHEKPEDVILPTEAESKPSSARAPSPIETIAAPSSKKDKKKKKKGKKSVASEVTTPAPTRPTSPVLGEPSEDAGLRESSRPPSPVLGELPASLDKPSEDDGLRVSSRPASPVLGAPSEDAGLRDLSRPTSPVLSDPPVALDKPLEDAGPPGFSDQVVPDTGLEVPTEMPGEGDQPSRELSVDDSMNMDAEIHPVRQDQEMSQGLSSTPAESVPEGEIPVEIDQGILESTRDVKPDEQEPLVEKSPSTKSKKKKGKKGKKGASETTTPAVSRPESPVMDDSSTPLEETREQPSAASEPAVLPEGVEGDNRDSELLPAANQQELAAPADPVQREPEVDERVSVGKKKKGKKGKKSAATSETTTPAISRPPSPARDDPEPLGEEKSEPHTDPIPVESGPVEAGPSDPAGDDRA